MSVPRRQTPMPPQLWAAGRPIVVRILVAVLGGWGAAQLTLWAFGLEILWSQLSLDSGAVRSGEYWRLLTSQLFHANVGHFVITILALFFAGREVEPIMGRRPFMGLCFAAGGIGSLVNCVVIPSVPACGFSAATAGIVSAYATILPELEHRLWFFFPRPLRLRAKVFITTLVLFAAVCLLTRSLLVVGPAGILVGTTLGWVWARQLGFGNPFWYQRRRNERRQQELRRARMTAEEFVAEEIDPILEKISRDGVGSITREERRRLEEARGKLARRHRE